MATNGCRGPVLSSARCLPAELKYNHGKGFRYPNIRELYMYAHRNQELQPEQMTDYDLDAACNLNDEWTFTADYAYLHTDTRTISVPKNKLFAEASHNSGQLVQLLFRRLAYRLEGTMQAL
ncbi:MAG: hypothetical protein NC344_00545 [Bacteroidales bacterium]|nr:hypothetical protein [Bacteroidales bacterium]MCM1146324.1 hypothetical protein [Bacteroidales bacterium]MCM1205238.1 hypothetical protein [Bacillota bacterium]MCM1509677.1 hypothetical protein [Clostridium sp.]